MIKFVSFLKGNWLLLAALSVLIIIFYKPISLVLNSIGSLGKTVVDSVTGVIDTGKEVGTAVGNELGVTSEIRDKVAQIEAPPTNSFWSPQFYKTEAANGALTPSTGQGYAHLKYIKEECQTFMGGVNMANYKGMFQGFPSQAYFSAFLHFWIIKEGSSWPVWARAGWMFGVVSAMGSKELVEIDAIISAKPIK